MSTVAPDLLEQVDLDIEPKCQGCDRPADFVARKFCDCVVLACQACVKATREHYDHAEFICGPDGVVPIKCLGCGSWRKFRALRLFWQILVAVVPL